MAFFIKRDRLFIFFVILLVFLLGIIRYNTFNRIDEDNLKNFIRYPKKTVSVIGEVAGDTDESRTGKKKNFILKAKSIRLNKAWQRADGCALVNVYGKDTQTFRYGDIVVLECTLRKPYSYRGTAKFDYERYLGDRRVYSILSVKTGSFVKKIGEDNAFLTRFTRAVYAIRSKLDRHINKFLKSPYAAIVGAIVLGKRRAIPPGIKDLFAKTGTLHILAISGLHVGIIYFALRFILKILRIHRNATIVLSILFLISYAVLTGARASILRAATMFSILGLGDLFKRKISFFNLIGLSCLIMLMINPNQIFSLGFVLSYAAVLSIYCVSPVLFSLFSVDTSSVGLSSSGQKIKSYLLRPVCVSMAASLGIFPIIAYNFGLITPIVVIANLIVIPLLVAVMGSTILFLTLGFLFASLAEILSQSIWFFLFVILKCVKLLESLPFAYFDVNPPPVYSIILYYVLVLAGISKFQHKKPTF